jgi:hypothetical protein
MYQQSETITAHMRVGKECFQFSQVALVGIIHGSRLLLTFNLQNIGLMILCGYNITQPANHKVQTAR